MKKEAQFIEHRFGKFRHFKQKDRHAIMILRAVERDAEPDRGIVWKIVRTLKATIPIFIESYLHGDPEAEYYGLN